MSESTSIGRDEKRRTFGRILVFASIFVLLAGFALPATTLLVSSGASALGPSGVILGPATLSNVQAASGMSSGPIQCASHGFPKGEPACWPMGPTEYGVNPANDATYTLKTQTWEASITINSISIGRNNCGNGCGGGEDTLTIQQNSVGNLSAHGVQQTYWTQNVPALNYYPASQSFTVIPLDNIWNFSGPFNISGPMTAIEGNQNGQCVFSGGAPELWYCEAAGVNNLHLPLTINTITSMYDVCAKTCTNYVTFYMQILHGSSVVYSNTYDKVKFTNGPALSAPSYYVVPCLPKLPFNAKNFGKCSVGTKSSPIGLPYDAEWILGGPGGGSQVNMNEINAKMSLYYWSSASSSYVSVPHAWSNGWDTAEGAGHVDVTSIGSSHVASAGSGTDDVESGLW